MKVGMIVMNYYPETCGGAERQCSRIVDELSGRGLHVTILTTRTCRETPKHCIDGNIEIIRLPRIEILFGNIRRTNKKSEQQTRIGKSDYGSDQKEYRRKFSLFSARLVKYLNTWLFMLMSVAAMWRLRSSIDIWHFHVASLISGWCGYWANYFKIPMVCKAANLPVFPEEPGVPLRKWLFKWRQQLHFVALTEEMREGLVSNGVAKERVSIIPNGVQSIQKAARPDPGVSGKVIYVANFTQPVTNKAFDVLFEAWVQVHKSRPLARLAVAGDGDSRVWREFLFRNKAEPSVEFLGYVDEVQQLYENALIMVLPSRREGISNALLEAQAAGIPAIVTDIPGNRLVVENYQTGYVVPVDDVCAIAYAIVTLLDDAELRTKMGERAYVRIAEKFSISAITDRYLALYNHLRALDG